MQPWEMTLTAHCHDERPPLLAQKPEPQEPKPLMPAVAAASRWHSMTLGELMQESERMIAEMTRR
jgi:hypothetical protein